MESVLGDNVNHREHTLLWLARWEDLRGQSVEFAHGDAAASQIGAQGALLELDDLLVDPIDGLPQPDWKSWIQCGERFTERIQLASHSRSPRGE